MKNLKLFTAILLLFVCFVINAQNVSISDIANDTPDNTAMLDVKSTSKGLLIPRLTQQQRNQITNAATGLMIFQSDQTKGFYYWTGTNWLHLTEGVEGMTTNTVPNWNGSQMTNSTITINNTSTSISGKTISTDTLKTQTRIKDKTGLVMPVGTILPFGGSILPEGWLWCDGSSYLVTKYSDLYTSIGIAWGGAINVSFNVPDLRGQFIRGADSMSNIKGSAGIDPDKYSRKSLNGGNSGNKVGSFESDTLESHNHIGTIQNSGSLSMTGSTSTDGNHNHYMGIIRDLSQQGFNNFQMTNNTNPSQTGRNTGDAGSHSHTVSVSGANHSHTISINDFGGSETRPKNAYVNYIIKY